MIARRIVGALRWRVAWCCVSMLAGVHACSDSGDGGNATGGAGGSTSEDGGNPDAAGTGGSDSGGSAGTGGSGGSDPALCGNATADVGEECDDGNAITGDGCEPDCFFTCVPGPAGDATCSDHLPCNGSEVCQADHTCTAGTPLPNGTTCGVDKSCVNGTCIDNQDVCGDGLFVSRSEECDDGNLTSGDGCEEDCRKTCLSTDSARNCSNPCAVGAACDDSTGTCIAGTPAVDGVSCGTDRVCRGGVCASAFCGNGELDSGEECDDENLVAGDGCENDCTFSCVASDESRNCRLTDPCQGTSTCDSTTHVCSTPTPLVDGTLCGPRPQGRMCISGVCKRPVCGNGVLEPTEICDDGNLVDSDGCKVDCTYSCTDASACGDARFCTQDVCSQTTHACSNPPNTSLNGQACNEGGVSGGLCRDGVCALESCGNGSIDSGEACDLGAQNGQTGSGCSAACLYECASDGACSDGNPCNGTETCVAVSGGQTCQSGTPLSTGDVCATSPRSICRSQTCQASTCGDGYVDPGTTPPEQCEPPNTATCSGNCQNI